MQPGVRIEETRVHRLTDADVSDEEPFSDRIDQLTSVLTTAPGERVVLVAHHAPFHVGGPPGMNRPGIDGGFQPPKDGSHGGTEEVPR